MFQSTTTSFSGAGPVRKPFSWTYSDLKNYRDCMKRHYHYKMAKVLGNLDDAIREPISEELQRGFDMHDAMAKRIGHKTPLPVSFVKYEPYARKLEEAAAKYEGAFFLVEQKWALDRNYAHTDYWGKKGNPPWFKQVVDVMLCAPHDGIALHWDWKTGKPAALRGYKDDPIQVLLGAAVLMMTPGYEWLQGVRCELIWVEHDMTTQAVITREEVPVLWAHILPEVNAMEQAYLTMNYPPKKNFLCREWCSVESCVHHGSSLR